MKLNKKASRELNPEAFLALASVNFLSTVTEI